MVPGSPASLLGRVLLSKVRVCIHFETDGVKVTDGQGCPFYVLTLVLADEYCLFTDAPKGLAEGQEEMQYWLAGYPRVWAEIAGVWFAEQQHL